MKRRQFLTILLSGTALVGCKEVLTPPTPAPDNDIQKVAGYLASIATAFTVMVPNLTFVSVSLRNQIAQWVSIVQSAASAVANNSSIAGTKDVVKQALAAISDIVNALSGSVVVPSEISSVLTAAQVLIPLIQTLMGLGVFSVRPRSDVMSEAQALAVLNGYAARNARMPRLRL